MKMDHAEYPVHGVMNLWNVEIFSLTEGDRFTRQSIRYRRVAAAAAPPIAF